MPDYTQDGRPFRLVTPLGKDTLLLVSWQGEERVSAPYRFTVEAWSTDPDIDVKQLLLEPVTLEVDLHGDDTRTIHGIVQRFVNAGPTSFGDLTAYYLDIVPPHWELSIGTGFEIFQDQPVTDIFDTVFKGYNLKKELNDPYDPRQYCFQYRESKWDFVSRLMEQGGIWYKFDHSAKPPTLVMASANATARVEWGLQDLVANHPDDTETRLVAAQLEHAPYVGKTKVRTYSEFLSAKKINDEVSALGGNGRFKSPAKLADYVYDQQVAAQRQGVKSGGGEDKPEPEKLMKDVKRGATLRQEQEETRALRLVGSTTQRGLASGAKVAISKHGNSGVNGNWMVLSVRHRGDNGGYLAGDEAGANYENDFEALPFDVPFRPARVTPWPRVSGTQVGIVTGPPGEEIFPDKFGRVQVAFRFDDEYEHDTKHSCWVRMAQLFAGPKFGSVFLPRIGHEVLVDFLDGNPDNPVIVGQLYSDKNLPPWTLPDNKTQSGFKTKSSSKGGTDDFNELRFEDKNGEEQIFMQAQKDLDVEVKNNETRKVKKDRTTTIEEGNETQTVSEGDETLEITKGSQTLTIGKDQTVKIDGKQTVTIKGEQKITVTGKISIESKQEILLKVGSNSIKIDNTGITIKGTMVKIEGSATAEMKSPMTTVKGDGMLTLKGGMTMIN